MNDLHIKFEGASNDIEANTLINSLLHFSNIVQEVNRELNTGRKIDIKIQSTERGSFIVHLALETTILDNIKNLLSNDSVQYIAGLSTIVTAIYGAAQFLKGDKPNIVEQKEDTVKIKNNNGSVQIFNAHAINIYTTNGTVREAISQEFKSLDGDKNVTGFEIKDKTNDVYVRIPADQFSDLSTIGGGEKTIDNRIITREAMLNIFKIVFDDTAKWEFYYDGNKISAKIEDDKFNELVDKGERFAKGDSLRAEIEITQKFEPSVNAYINKGYKVVKILEHIPRAEQGNMFQ